MGRSAQLMLPDVEPKHRQLLTVYQPGLNSGSTRARHVHWETMKEWDSRALVKWVSAQGSYSRRTCACGGGDRGKGQKAVFKTGRDCQVKEANLETL